MLQVNSIRVHVNSGYRSSAGTSATRTTKKVRVISVCNVEDFDEICKYRRLECLMHMKGTLSLDDIHKRRSCCLSLSMKLLKLNPHSTQKKKFLINTREGSFSTLSCLRAKNSLIISPTKFGKHVFCFSKQQFWDNFLIEFQSSVLFYVEREQETSALSLSRVCNSTVYKNFLVRRCPLCH